MRTDYLIIGTGIAGSLLSRALARLGRTILLVGSPRQPGSSPVAAWMINPITGLRFSASWRIESLQPYARNVYRELEKESGLTLFHEQPIQRFFKSDGERERWEKKETDPLVSRYATLTPLAPGDPLFALNTHGCISICQGGRLELPDWLDYHRNNPTPGILYREAHVEAGDLSVGHDQVEWQGQCFGKVIFCTGYSHWPWFDWLPWKAAKGEIMTLRIPGLSLDRILKKGIFLIPLGGDLYRLGATYSWSLLDDQATQTGLEELLKALHQLLPLPVEVVSHRAAVRPSFQGTIPAIGLHPRHPCLGLFNGLGSKGGLSAPWLADHFAAHLENGQPIDAEVDIARNT